MEVYSFFSRQTCQAAARIGKIDKASKLLGELSYRIRERVFVLLFFYTLLIHVRETRKIKTSNIQRDSPIREKMK